MNSNTRKIVFFILILAIAYLAYSYMIKPANSHLAKASVRLEKKEAKLKQIEKVTNAADDLGKKLKELEKAIEILESKLPPRSETHKVLERVTVIAQNQSLHPKTIRTLQERNNSGYIELPLRMQLVGEFSSFYSFLLEMEKMPRIMKFRHLEINKLKDADGKIEASFVVSIFFENKV